MVKGMMGIDEVLDGYDSAAGAPGLEKRLARNGNRGAARWEERPEVDAEVYKENMPRSLNRRSAIVNNSMPLPSPNVIPLEQEWYSSGSCPEGTIPIRRMLKSTTIKAASSLGVATELPAGVWFHHDNVIMDESNTPRNEFAVAYGLDGPYHGASALLPLLRPTKLDPNEATLPSILIAVTMNREWITRHSPGDFPPDSTNQISVGLVASTSIYGNDDPNLFVYYTADGGKSYCLNLDCPGFVQTSNRIALGTSFINGGSSITYNGVPYVSISIHRVPGQQQWWVTVNDTVIGYYPHTLFPTFFPESFLNQVGGIVYNSRPNGIHTETVMGNGNLPDSGGAAIVKGYLAVAEDWTDKQKG
ncbi:hypothetical protein EJB05_18507, partial [Eragrostis curvula]